MGTGAGPRAGARAVMSPKGGSDRVSVVLEDAVACGRAGLQVGACGMARQRGVNALAPRGFV